MRLTGSRLPIARHCRWPFREDVAFPDIPPNDDAELGKAFHAPIAALLQGKDVLDVSDDVLPLYMSAATWWQTLHRVPTATRTEVAFAYDVTTRTARILGYDIGRAYAEHGAKAHELCCSVDYVYIVSPAFFPGVTSNVVVGDWKTGWAGHVDAPRNNAQLLFAALCASRAMGLDSARIEISHVKRDDVYCEAVDVTYELKLFEAELHEILGNIAGAEAAEGNHCQFCPALGACPATKQNVSALVPAEKGSPVVWTSEFISTENDAAMAMRLSMLKKAVEMINDALNDRVRKGGGTLVLPNGKVYREITYKKPAFSSKKAKELLGARVSECESETEVSSFRVVNAK